MHQMIQMNQMSQPGKRDEPARVTFFSLIQSTCAAFFGVQSEANRQRDFASGKFWHFVVAGIIFVLIFIGLVYGAVRLLLAGAT